MRALRVLCALGSRAAALPVGGLAAASNSIDPSIDIPISGQLNWHGGDAQGPFASDGNYWAGQLLDSNGKYFCEDFHGIAPTCLQCIRGSGGVSMLPPSTDCGLCLRDPTTDQCTKCWDSLPQVFDIPERLINLHTRCHIRLQSWELEPEAYCDGPGELISIGALLTSESWHHTVMQTAPLCEHLCRRWAFKLGGDQICCSTRDGEDYPNLEQHPEYIKQYNYSEDGMCKAVQEVDPTLFTAGKMYKCSDLSGKNKRLMGGCWAKRNGWAQKAIEKWGPYSTDQTRNARGELANPGLSRAVTCEGLGAYYDQSGDVVMVKKGLAADRAGIKPGMRITAIETGDPAAPLPELTQPRKWHLVNDSDDREVRVAVLKTSNGGLLGASLRQFSGSGPDGTGHGVKIGAVNPKMHGGIYEAMMEGWPEEWSGLTGTPGTGPDHKWNCQGGKYCLPGLRRGARPGFILRKIHGVEIRTLADVARELAKVPTPTVAEEAKLTDVTHTAPRGSLSHPPPVCSAEEDSSKWPAYCVVITVQVDAQAMLDRLFAQCSPDDRLTMYGDKAPPDNHGINIIVRDGPGATPFQGVNGGASVGGNYVSHTGTLLPGHPHGRYKPLDPTAGAPCEACIRQMPGVKVFAGCAQALCDFTPMAPPAAAEGTAAPLGTVSDTHSFWDCKRECCKNENCASLKWNAGQLTCDLYDVSYEVAGFKASAAAAENNDCAANGCVSDKICEWTPMYEGSSRQQVLQTVKKVRTLDECRLECCKKGSKCKAVGWHATPTDGSDNDCDLYGGFYDAVDWGKNGDGVFLSNKWNGPLNPTCKFCVDKMDVDAIDGVCTACKTHGLQADCDQCWQAFANAGPDCETCWAAFSPFLSHLWGIKPSAVASAEATARAAALRSHRAGAAAGVVAVALAAAAAAAAFARRRAAPPAAKAEEATYGAL